MTSNCVGSTFGNLPRNGSRSVEETSGIFTPTIFVLCVNCDQKREEKTRRDKKKVKKREKKEKTEKKKSIHEES